MNKTLLVLFIAALFASVSWAKPAAATSYLYSVPDSAWQESLGNHRAVISVAKSADVAHLAFRWRRADADVANHRFIIVESASGDTVPSIQRISVDNQLCDIKFGPVKAGTYYFYYLPYNVQIPARGFTNDYVRLAPGSESAVLKGKSVEAKVMKVESRTVHDSFFPMEIACSDAEMQQYAANSQRPFYVFGEDRTLPVRMRHALPFSWLGYVQGQTLKLSAQPNEYYAFQAVLWSPAAALDSVTYSISDFTGTAGVIPSKLVTCFNHEGVNPDGKPFIKRISVAKGAVQPLWFGIDLPSDAIAGTYSATLSFKSSAGDVQSLPISLTIAGSPLADRGDSETWRHSRLRWLNSTLGIADAPTDGFSPMSVVGDTVHFSGRALVTDASSPLPSQLMAGNNKLLSAPMRFVITTADGDKSFKAVPSVIESTSGHTLIGWQAEDADLSVSCRVRSEFDGWSDYSFTILPKRDLKVSDIRLEMDFLSASTPLFMGLGLAGQETPVSYQGTWKSKGELVRPVGAPEPNIPHDEWLYPFDSFWIGGAHAGVQCEFRGANYTGPMLNLYLPSPPASWNNGGKGGFRISRVGTAVTRVTAFSGSRDLHAAQLLPFEFSLILTPVKSLNTASQFTDRYYHCLDHPIPTDSDINAGVRIINVHHATFVNPTINYPFLTADKLRNFVSEWHSRGCKVKVYYTVRELSSVFTELWAARSLGNEILHTGGGGGYPWLREHLVSDYVPQWYHRFLDFTMPDGISADAAILTAEGETRWFNYYVEGLRWLVKNTDIDGIYLDDVAFGRQILKRMRRAMESVKPGCVIDLHSNTDFSRGPANQYIEFFPYINKTWFGEGFQYNHMSPANWLVETSGIPFGLMGDMLQGGGNLWLGMQYGMTSRRPWVTDDKICDPRPVWKVWDSFDIAHSSMIGYWEPDVPVVSDNPAVKVTVYRHSDGRTLLSVGNYSDSTLNVHLKFSKSVFGKNVAKMQLVVPEIANFQNAATWHVSDAISVAPKKGWLIYLQK
jgi:hypothetical protein